MEVLEPRRLLTTTVFLDFGAAINETITADDLRDIDGETDTGPDINGVVPLGSSGTDLDFLALDFDFNLDGGFDAADTTALQNAVLPIVQQAFLPFDIDVQPAAAATFDDVRDSLHANDTGMPGFDTFGENDAYIFVSAVQNDLGLSVTEPFDVLGFAASADLQDGDNTRDEVAVTFSDNVLKELRRDHASEEGTAKFNDRLVHRLASVAAHEAGHTFGLEHVADTLLGHGDIMHVSFDRQHIDTTTIFTRFSQSVGGGLTQNNFARLAGDSDIGLRDADLSGIPDTAFVTGTGGHDHIQITWGGGNDVNVTVSAFDDADRTILIASESYSIEVGVDTDLGILVDASTNDDFVDVASDLPFPVTIRGGRGDDTLIGGNAADNIDGGEGADWIVGNAGDDVLHGGAGADFVNGNGGNDTLDGGEGNDILAGHANDDLLLGGDGDDTIEGGDGGDWIVGNAGNDFLDGGYGNDFVNGNDGDDTLHGGEGNDILAGHADNDLITGGGGNDLIDGGYGNDTLFGGAGNDTLSGGAGVDAGFGGDGIDEDEDGLIELFSQDGPNFPT